MKQEFSTPTAKDLSEMDSKILDLKQRAETSQIRAKAAFDTQLRAVEDQYDLVVAKMNRAENQADSVAGEIKNGLSKAWINLKTSFDKASEYLH